MQHDDIRTRPPLPKVARYFNLAVAALVFCMMLAFATWATVSSFTEGRTEFQRASGGAVMGFGALVLLAAVYEEWRTGQPFQHSRRSYLGFSLVGIGGAVLVAG